MARPKVWIGLADSFHSLNNELTAALWEECDFQDSRLERWAVTHLFKEPLF